MFVRRMPRSAKTRSTSSSEPGRVLHAEDERRRLVARAARRARARRPRGGRASCRRRARRAARPPGRGAPRSPRVAMAAAPWLLDRELARHAAGVFTCDDGDARSQPVEEALAERVVGRRGVDLLDVGQAAGAVHEVQVEVVVEHLGDAQIARHERQDRRLQRPLGRRSRTGRRRTRRACATPRRARRPSSRAETRFERPDRSAPAPPSGRARPRARRTPPSRAARARGTRRRPRGGCRAARPAACRRSSAPRARGWRRGRPRAAWARDRLAARRAGAPRGRARRAPRRSRASRRAISCRSSSASRWVPSDIV